MFKERVLIVYNKVKLFLKVFLLYMIFVTVIASVFIWADRNLSESFVAKINDNIFNMLIFVLILIVLYSITKQTYKFIKWLFIEPLLKGKKTK